MFLKVILILTVMVGISSSSAINLQKFHFSNSPVYATLEGSLLEDGHVNTDYKYIFVGSYNYVRAPFVELDNNNRSKDIIRWMHTLNVGGAYRFSKNLQVGLSTFFTYQKAIPSDEENNYDKEFSLGDTTVDLKYKIFEQSRLALAFTPRLYLNTGDEEYYTSNGEIGFYLGFALEKAFKYFQVTLNLGHKENKNAEFKEVNHEQQLHTAVGGLVPLTENLDLTAEFFRDTPYDSDIDQIPSELDVGVRYELSKYSALFGGVGTGSLDSDESTDLRLYAGYKYYPKEGDSTPLPIKKDKMIKEKKTKKIKKEEKVYGQFFKYMNIYFDTSSSAITKLESMKIDKMIEVLSEEEKISKIVVEGYTSKVGSAALNKRLSNKRIKSAVDYITKKGIDVKLIQKVSYGNEMADETDANKTTDRKVMFRIYRNR